MRLRRKRLSLVLAALAAFVILSHSWWLAAMGSFLVRAGEPHTADAVVVLAGDWSGGRILKGAELVREGYAPVAIVSGGEPSYGVAESHMAIDFAVQHGFQREDFVPIEEPAFSTKEEVGPILRELKRLKARSALVVTSNYHTRRARRIWRSQAPGFSVTLIAAPDRFYSTGGWWKNREGRETAFYEWVKTVTEPFGI